MTRLARRRPCCSRAPQGPAGSREVGKGLSGTPELKREDGGNRGAGKPRRALTGGPGTSEDTETRKQGLWDGVRPHTDHRGSPRGPQRGTLLLSTKQGGSPGEREGHVLWATRSPSHAASCAARCPARRPRHCLRPHSLAGRGSVPAPSRLSALCHLCLLHSCPRQGGRGALVLPGNKAQMGERGPSSQGG